MEVWVIFSRVGFIALVKWGESMHRCSHRHVPRSAADDNHNPTQRPDFCVSSTKKNNKTSSFFPQHAIDVNFVILSPRGSIITHYSPPSFLSHATITKGKEITSDKLCARPILSWTLYFLYNRLINNRTNDIISQKKGELLYIKILNHTCKVFPIAPQFGYDSNVAS